MLQVSAFSKHSVESKQEQPGCPTTDWHVLPASHTKKFGALVLHSQLGGVVVILQVSAFSRHCVASIQEHPGWPVIVWHSLPTSQTEKLGALALHSQLGGVVVILQVSALSRHCVASRQEQAGCPRIVVWHSLPESQTSKLGVLKLHSQLGGAVVILQVSAFSRH